MKLVLSNTSQYAARFSSYNVKLPTNDEWGPGFATND